MTTRRQRRDGATASDAESNRSRRDRWRPAPPPVLAEHDIAIPGLDPRHDGVRIAQLSDVHAGPLTPRSHVRHAVALANDARPDVIVLTGDYVNWRRREIAIMKDNLAGLSAPRVVVTLGNHDYYASGDEVAQAMREVGYDVLRNQNTTVDAGGAPLDIVGIDDPVTGHHDLDAAFAGLPARAGGAASGPVGSTPRAEQPSGRRTRIALCHTPSKADAVAARGVDLVLSGHTHGGQIFVKGITDRVARRMGLGYLSGHYALEGAQLYVTSGVGYSGVRVRAGAGTRSEVAVLTLRAA